MLNGPSASFDLDLPEERARALHELGLDGYNHAMLTHLARSTVAIVNGYVIRRIRSRYSEIFVIVGADIAAPTYAAARHQANDLPHGPAFDDWEPSNRGMSNDLLGGRDRAD
jgi:hypothetical protein